MLLGLWKFLTAENVRVEEVTADIQQMLAAFTPEMSFDKSYWPQLCFFALVQPCDEILPVRTTYNHHSTNIGVNPLRSEQPIWYAGPDIIAAMLRTGKPPKIIRAIRIVPDGQQKGMRPLRLRKRIEIDPRIQDFFKSVIEARAATKHDEKLTAKERDALCYFLKIFASAVSYGLFMEVNPRRVCKGEREHIRVFSGDVAFPTTSEIVEGPGRWYCPIIGSLITAAGRLMLALIEYSVNKRGGSYLFCDTDSLAIVANRDAGLVACRGGQFFLPDGREAVKALSWRQVEEIRNEMDRLNPYDRNIVPNSILKIEKINNVNGVQRQLFGYAIASKRYALYEKTPSGIEIVSAKAHGLGFLQFPKKGYDKKVDAPAWVVEAWEWLLGEVGIGPRRAAPSWFSLPAMMKCVITTREVLRALQVLQANVPYTHRAGKPFNFVVIPLMDELDGSPIGIDPEKFSIVAPFTSDSSRWYDLKFVNIYDKNIGTSKVVQYELGKRNQRLPSQALPKTYGDFVERYRWHPEAKSNGPDNCPCESCTKGLLTRMPVIARHFGYIGKETDRKWEQGEDISLLESEVTEYRPNETEKLVVDAELQHNIRRISIRKLAKAAGVTENTVKRARRGERLQKNAITKLRRALEQQRSKVDGIQRADASTRTEKDPNYDRNQILDSIAHLVKLFQD